MLIIGERMGLILLKPLQQMSSLKVMLEINTRFEFNDEGKVSWVGNLSEDI